MYHLQEAQFQMETLLLPIAKFRVRSQHDLE